MTWAEPHWLPWLVVVLIAGFMDLRSRPLSFSRVWPNIRRLWAGPSGVQEGDAGGMEPRRVFLWLGLAFLVLALARPQWGRTEEKLFDQSREVLLSLDLSRSMLAEDVKPSRLERGKLLINNLLDGLQGERVGLMLFSGSAFLQVPLSSDYEVLRDFLPELNPQFLPEGGTEYGLMLDTALDAFGTGGDADRYLIVLSDGESLSDDWHKRVAELKERHIRVIGLGIGTEAGGLVPDVGGGYIKDERGAAVLTKLNASTLIELAQATEGEYRDASAWVDLAALLKATIDNGAKGKFDDKTSVKLTERFQWFLVPAFFCLLMSLIREFPSRPKLRVIRMSEEAVEAELESAPRRIRPETGGRKAGGLFVWCVLAAVLCTGHVMAQGTQGTQGTGDTNVPPDELNFPPGAKQNPVRPFDLEGMPEPGEAPQAADALPPGLPPGVVGNPALPSVANAGAPEDVSTGLVEVVGKLASNPKPTGADFSEMAKETIKYAQKMLQKQVPEGLDDVIMDGLDGVDAGEKLDAKAADWTEERRELKELLKRQKQQQEQKQQQQGKQGGQQGQKKGQGQDKNGQQQGQKGGQGQQPQDGKGQQGGEKGQGQQGQQNQPGGQQKGGEKGEGQDQQGQQQGDGEQGEKKGDQGQGQNEPSQKIGGNSNPMDNYMRSKPELAEAINRLNRVREKDSPARLFQLLQGNSTNRPSNGKNW